MRSPRYLPHRIVLLVVLAALAAGGFLYARRDRSGPGPPSRLVSYRITYAVTVTIGRPERSTRVLTVRRPFEARDETIKAGASGPSSVFLTSRDRTFALDNGNASDYGPRPAGPPPQDSGLAEEMPELLQAGLAVAGGTASYAGRPCHLYRIGGPVSELLKAPTPAEHADICLDRDGLVLLEDWVSSGKPLRRTEAVRVETSVSGPLSFTVPSASPLPFAMALQGLSRKRVPDVGTPYWVVNRAPWGFRLADRVRNFSTDPNSPVGETFVDTYVRDTYVLNVEQSRNQPSDTGKIRDVDVGEIGSGVLVAMPEGPELHFNVNGWYVVLRANFDVPRLLEMAARLFPESLPPSG